MRKRLHAWGVDRMNSLLAKEKELIRLQKEKMKHQKDLMIQKGNELIECAKSTFHSSNDKKN